MKVGRLGAAGTVGLFDVDAPVAGPGELIVRMAACGICGTDLEKVRGGYARSTTLGHEPVGIVESVGAGVAAPKVGDRVFVHHHVPCYRCAVCERGEYPFCPEYARTNLDPGGFAERFRVSREHVERGAVLPLDDSVSWEVGTLLEPAGCALTALHRVGFTDGQSVFLVGLGPAGLLYGRLARALGARWVGGAEISARRRAAAEAGGFDATVDPRDPAAVRRLVESATRGEGVDLSVVAASAAAAARLALDQVRPGGTVNLFGVPAPESRLEEPLQSLYLRGVRIIPAYATTDPEIRAVQEMVVAGRLPLDGLVSDRFPLGEIAAAFDRAARPSESLRVVVTGPGYGSD
ncbi:MAG: alcohol dehydrogenase catalytic domain-containing protein [Thermoplasmata archaeon]